jgi:prepilin-type N-terminal cleavage/methylation domain-containing protein
LLCGFTLVEVLVTVVVIAMGCLAALWLQSAAMRGNSQSDHLTVAGFLAESEIERLKSLDFAAATKEAEDHETAPVVQNLNRWGEIQTDGSGVYTRTVRYFPKRPTSLSHQVEVEVAWRDNHGSHRLDYTAALTDCSLN